jgi:hypothetical protein
MHNLIQRIRIVKPYFTELRLANAVSPWMVPAGSEIAEGIQTDAGSALSTGREKLAKQYGIA